MALRPIITIGNSVLRKKAKPVPQNKIRTMEMRTLVEDMQETRQAAKGIGLSAPQISVLKQVVVINIPHEIELHSVWSKESSYVLFNPRITEIGPDTKGYWEECLSVPNLKGFVVRPTSITVEYLDQYAIYRVVHLENFRATVFQHEMDHLNGKLYTDFIEGLPYVA
ncbi:peptide deformylase [bacterium]|nr:peptide deformylase [bacterium]|tara:strand:+ start:367 stop:867 length:501 start_codon:yes stop_codon:yes gene_type:complete